MWGGRGVLKLDPSSFLDIPQLPTASALASPSHLWQTSCLRSQQISLYSLNSGYLRAGWQCVPMILLGTTHHTISIPEPSLCSCPLGRRSTMTRLGWISHCTGAIEEYSLLEGA